VRRRRRRSCEEEKGDEKEQPQNMRIQHQEDDAEQAMMQTAMSMLPDELTAAYRQTL
jgi:hypothetical protein